MLHVHIRKTLGDFTIKAAFDAPGRGVTALFGPSGAGKTSIIRMLAGLIHPDEGAIEIMGRTLYDSRRGIRLPPEKRRIGYVFQDGRLFPHLSVRGNLVYGIRRVPAALRYMSLERIVVLLGIEHLLRRRPGRLSGGEKQRVAIGRALLCSPTLLLMDEPLASLDDARKDEVIPFIAALAAQMTVPIVYVTHDRNEIMALANHVVHLQKGAVVAKGAVAHLTGPLADPRENSTHTGQLPAGQA